LITGMLPSGSMRTGAGAAGSGGAGRNRHRRHPPRPPFGHRLRLRGGDRQLRIAGQLGTPVDAHGARPADGVPAGAAEGERAVLLVLHRHERFEHRRAVGQLDLVALPAHLWFFVRAGAPHLERRADHQYVRSSGWNLVIDTGWYSHSGPSADQR
jgi:hypothetical protein